jgi:hypothetical protein
VALLPTLRDGGARLLIERYLSGRGRLMCAALLAAPGAGRRPAPGGGRARSCPLPGWPGRLGRVLIGLCLAGGQAVRRRGRPGPCH